jgi:hypothetical protein
MQSKEGGNVYLKITITHSLGDGVSSIAEWTNLSMGPRKAFLLQVQPLYLPLETCEEPIVDHGVVYTWHWTSIKYFEPVGGCVGSTQ